MPWPGWLSFWRNGRDEDSQTTEHPASTEPTAAFTAHHEANTSIPSKPAVAWETSLNATDWSHYTSPQTITMCIITTATTLALVRLYKMYIRRIPTVEYLKPGLFRRRSLYGYVTRVGDGDNFHLYHTPGGRLLGWGWLAQRRVQNLTEKEAKGKTVHVRIAGVDAPEAAHFGRPAQPHSREALDWLRSFVLHKYVRAYPFRRDQYDRVVCAVYKRKWVFLKSDVGLEMLRKGLATVYEAKFGSEFGDKEAEYREAEEQAKKRQVGIWQQPGIVGKMLGRKTTLESPREYKTRMQRQEKDSKTAELAK